MTDTRQRIKLDIVFGGELAQRFLRLAAQCRHDKAFGFWENWRPNACGAEPIYPERCLFAKYRVTRYMALGFGAWGLDFGLKLEKMVHSTGFEPVTSALGSIQVYKYN